MALIAYLIGIVSGVAATVQASFNGETRSRLRSPYITAAINFVVALSLIAVILLITEHSLALPFEDILKYPPWIWLGGVCGVTIVMAGILCLPVLGSARNMMLLCFGQIMAGLLIDHFGLFGAPVTGMSLMRAAGAVLEIAGIAFISVEKGESGRGGMSGRVILFIVFDIFTGFVAAAQVAVNGTLGIAADSPVRATLVSMSVALLTTSVIICLITVFGGRKAVFDGDAAPEGKVCFSPVFLMGGLMALVVVGGNAVTGPILGTGMVTMMNLFGMMASGLVVDATGFLGLEKKPVTFRKLLGMALMLAGTAMISL